MAQFSLRTKSHIVTQAQLVKKNCIFSIEMQFQSIFFGFSCLKKYIRCTLFFQFFDFSNVVKKKFQTKLNFAFQVIMQPLVHTLFIALPILLQA